MAKVKAPKLTAARVKLDRGGYVRKGESFAGRYFGVGEPVWIVSDDDETMHEFVRAKTRKDAIAKVMQRAIALYARHGTGVTSK